MIILWIKRNDKDEPYPRKEEDGESFRKHDESMKRFRVAHPRIEPVKPKEVSPMNYLIPARRVTLSEHTHN